MSQNFDLGPGFIFYGIKHKNSEKIFLQIFYITLQMNQDLNQNVETSFPRELYRDHALSIWLHLINY